MLTRTQSNRLIRLNTQLGDDALKLVSFQGEETLSSLFHYRIHTFSEQSPIAPPQILGKPVAISLSRESGDERHIHGIVNSFEYCSYDHPRSIYHYTLTIVPWFWLLTKRTDCRIFQGKSIVHIAEEIFQDFGVSDYEMELSKQYPAYPYCVQYRESSFHFLSRLFEKEGIFYFFRHEAGRHVLVVADDAVAHKDCPGDGLVYQRPDQAGRADTINDWHELAELPSSSVMLDDFNFETPAVELAVGFDSKSPASTVENLELYDYPGGFLKRDEGERLARLGTEVEEAHAVIFTGGSNALAVQTGCAFVLRKHDVPRYDGQRYTILSVSSEGSNNWDSLSADFHNTFRCMENKITFRPKRLTSRPVIRGSQTAIVTGPSGEEIHTDKHGRVKVQFHWDRRGRYDENSSCWIRVAQGWAGNRWGAMFIPRVGEEVIVGFLEGDPDRPIVTGRVYNAANVPPYDLPGEKTKSVIRSRSSKGGGGFNEISFDDKNGEEHVFIHAQKDQHNLVRHDSKETVERDRHLAIKRDQLETVERDKHLKVAGDHNEKVDGTISLEAGQDMQEKVGMKHALDAGMEIHLKSGMNVVIEAGMSITLKAGGGFIVVGPVGVTIVGTPVLINSGGATGSGSGASPDAPRQAEALRNAARTGIPFCAKCTAQQTTFR